MTAEVLTIGTQQDKAPAPALAEPAAQTPGDDDDDDDDDDEKGDGGEEGEDEEAKAQLPARAYDIPNSYLAGYGGSVFWEGERLSGLAHVATKTMAVVVVNCWGAIVTCARNCKTNE